MFGAGLVPGRTPNGRKGKVKVYNVDPTQWQAFRSNILEKFGVITGESLEEEANGLACIVEYENPDDGRRAVQELNNQTLYEQTLKLVYVDDNHGKKRNGGGPRGGPGGGRYRGMRGQGQGHGPQNHPSEPEFPLRILIPADMVGAVIGKAGKTIQTITSDSKARQVIVDVHKKESRGVNEKPVTITGTTESCINALREIYTLIQREEETKSKDRGDEPRSIPLKILGPHFLIGRLIGQGGHRLRAIKEKTSTDVSVSKVDRSVEFVPPNQDRTITISGPSVEQVINAANMVLEKLRSSFSREISMSRNAMMPPSPYVSQAVMSNPHVQSMVAELNAPQRPYMMPPMGGGLLGYPNGNSYGGYGSGYNSPSHYMGLYQNPLQNQTAEKILLAVPEKAAGAIIGYRGQNAQETKNISGANVRVLPKEKIQHTTMEIDPATGLPREERLVDITGNSTQQFLALLLIFHKLKQQGFYTTPSGDLRLRVEMKVDTDVAGRIIGKGGSKVKDIQKESKAQVKVSEKAPEEEATAEDREPPSVCISGTFQQIMSAHDKIREVINRARQQQQQHHPPDQLLNQRK